MTDLGTLKHLDARTAWSHEAHDFTPWLAVNLDELGRALGFDLELVQTEQSVGSFNVDIVAKHLGRDCLVVIENQLERTDHSHLGQLITYAAGIGAEIVVWVSPEFREEHRQALDWLNAGHGTSTDFFGVVVELLQIDDSKPAVHFRVVASPNEWTRTRRRSRTGDSGSSGDTGSLTPRQEAYLSWFQALIDTLRVDHRFTNAKAGQPQNWYSFSSGVRGFVYSVSFAQGGRIRAEIYIDDGNGDRNAMCFTALEDMKNQIEQEFGETLTWESLETKRACRVAVYRDGSINDADDDLEAYRAWAVDRMLKFKSVFGPKIARL